MSDDTQPLRPGGEPEQPRVDLDKHAPGHACGPGYPPPPYGYAAPPYAPYYGPPPTSRPVIEQRFGPVAGFGARLGAYLIDVAFSMFWLALSIGCWVWTFTGEVDWTCHLTPELGDGDAQTCDVSRTSDHFGLALTLAILSVLLFLGMTWWNRCFRAGRGASLGKSALALRIINVSTGQPIGAGRALARDLVNGAADSLISCIPLGRLWAAWDEDRQTLGDKAVSSTVIHDVRR